MPSDQIAYSQKYVCFLDILGFSAAIKHPEHRHFIRSIGYFRTALDCLKDIPSQPDLCLTGIQVSQFSDCVAFSCDISPESLYMLFERVAHLQRKLLQGGLPSHGHDRN